MTYGAQPPAAYFGGGNDSDRLEQTTDHTPDPQWAVDDSGNTVLVGPDGNYYLQSPVQSGIPIILAGSGSFNTTGLLTLTGAMAWAGGTPYPFAAFVYIASSNGLSAGVYPAKVESASTIQLTAPYNVTTSGSYAGTTSEVTIASVTLPGGSLKANGKLWIRYVAAVLNGTSGKTVKTKYGAQEVSNITLPSSGGYSGLSEVFNAGSESLQIIRTAGIGSQGIGNMTGVPLLSAIDSSANQLITITAQLTSATESLAICGYAVEISPKA